MTYVSWRSARMIVTVQPQARALRDQQQFARHSQLTPISAVMKSGSTILLGYVGVVSLLMLVVLAANFKLADMASDVKSNTQLRLSAIQTAADATSEMNISAANLRNLLFGHGRQDKPTLTSMATDDQPGKAAPTNLRTLAMIVDDTGVMEATVVAHDAWQAARNKLLAMVRQGKTEEARLYFVHEFVLLHQKYNLALDTVLHGEIARTDSLITTATHRDLIARVWLLGLIAIAILLTIGSAVMITRSVSASLSWTEARVRRMVEGDLNREPDGDSPGVSQELVSALDELQELLRSVLGRIRTVADEIEHFAHMVAKDLQALSVQNQQQASSLLASGSKLQELKLANVREVTNVREAGLIAASASELTEHVSTVVDQFVQALSSVTRSRNAPIVHAVKVNGIAIKSAVLALNATEEAARAGSEAHGLLMLACEARTLAKYSADADKEIKRLLEDLIVDASGASEVAMQAGTAIADMLASAERAANSIKDLSASAEAKSTCIDHVNDTIVTSEEIAQHNKKLLENLARTSGNLRARAEALHQTAAIFKWGSQTMPAAMAVAAPPARPSSVPIVRRRSLTPSVLQRGSTRTAVKSSANEGWKHLGAAPVASSASHPMATPTISPATQGSPR